MKIPADARVVTDRRLTAIKAITQLYDRFVDCEGGLNQVKGALKAKDATFAQSELVQGQLKPGGKSQPDPAKTFALVAAGKLTLCQFLSLVTVNKSKLEKILPGAEVDELSVFVAWSQPALYADWKEGIVFDADAAIAALESSLIKSNKPKRSKAA